MNFEALATECRTATFRESLVASTVWTQAAETIDDHLQLLKNQITYEAPQNLSKMEEHDAKANNDGMGYTFCVHSTNPTAEMLQHNFSPPKPVVKNWIQVVGQVDAVTTVFRFLRNACVACTVNQTACLDAGLFKKAHDVVMHCCQWVDVEDAPLKAHIVLLAQVVLQFCVNGVTSNGNNQETVWTLFFPDDFQKILIECHQYRKIVAFAVALMLNCVNSKSTDTSNFEKVATRRADLVCARNVLITILHRCIGKPSNSLESSASVTSGPYIDNQDPAFEWISTLFGVLFHDNCVKDLYNAVGAHMLSKLWSRVTPEQLILLRMFRMWVLTPSFTSATKFQEETHKQQQFPGGTFEFVKSTWVYIVTEGNEDRPIEKDEVRKQVWIELESNAKLMLLDVLGELSVDHTRISTEGTRELLLSLLKELQRVWQLGCDRLTTRNSRDIGSMSRLTNGDPFGYRSAMIRVIGNLCFRQTDHQDLVRKEGYLSLFLNHCNIDEGNPMIREWSLVALRNLCERNEANQRYIETLRPQGMDAVSDVVLEKAKMHADIGEDGRVKLTKKER